MGNILVTESVLHVWTLRLCIRQAGFGLLILLPAIPSSRVIFQVTWLFHPSLTIGLFFSLLHCHGCFLHIPINKGASELITVLTSPCI